MDGQYAGSGSVAARDETRRPMVERAAPSQLTKEQPLLMQVMNRINEAQNRVADVAALLNDKANDISGSVPEPDTARAAVGSPCGGVLGGIFEQVGFLEQRVARLEEQAQRFKPLA